jgi:hypothetical protein
LVVVSQFWSAERVIADSPYRTSEPLLTPREGALVGAVASLSMLPALSLLHPLAGPSGTDLLVRIGQAILRQGDAAGSGSTLVAAGGVHALIGALLGILYAVSQDRAPARTLIAVGLFYGVVVWAGSRVITAWVFGPVFRTALHAYTWLLACALYGVLLGGYAAFVERRRPRDARVVPVD